MSILTQCCHFHLHHRRLHVSRFNNLFQVLHITDKSNTHFFVNAMMNFSLLAAHPHRSFWFFLCKLYMKRCGLIAWYTDSILFSFFYLVCIFLKLEFLWHLFSKIILFLRLDNGNHSLRIYHAPMSWNCWTILCKCLYSFPWMPWTKYIYFCSLCRSSHCSMGTIPNCCCTTTITKEKGNNLFSS